MFFRVYLVQMKIVSYNVRGLRGFEKISEVKRLVTDKKPVVLCLQETKLSVVDDLLINSIWGNSSLGFSYQSSIGASGGLLTVWDCNVVDVWSTMSFPHVLVIKGRVLCTSQEFIIANVCAPCDTTAKQVLWDPLQIFMTNNGDTNLCLCGDFNSVRSSEERKGRGSFFRQHDSDIFNKLIDEGSLIDQSICGRLYTWYRGDEVSMSRLDRFLLSSNWCTEWPDCIQLANQRGLSNHVPLELYADVDSWGPRPFRMPKCWADYTGYEQFVREKWGSFSIERWGAYVLTEKLKLIKGSLREWHQRHSQNLIGKCNTVKERMSTLDIKGETSTLDEEEVIELHDLSVNLHSLLRVQTSMCWQQAQTKWLQEGDANTKFFNGLMSSRRRHNSIQLLQVDGAQVVGVQNIRSIVFNHFSSHFKRPDEVRPGVDNLNFCRLSVLEEGSLTNLFILDEVKQAIWDCNSFKSPGPDGISFGFIKQFWNDLKDDFMCFISEFYRNGRLTKGINTTFIALIPKVSSPQRLNGFHPISLVGCMYKVLAKILANRLRAVIGSVVSDLQSAFVKGKQILDGILVANEAVDEARRLRKDMLLFKVNFEKAYDSVDLSYLDMVMQKMNFPTRWRKWMSECVGTATASVLVNGSPTEEFPMERGLRQGDPLSPFLFLLAGEGFNVIMLFVIEAGLFNGYRVGRDNDLCLSHLQFADDTLIIGDKSWLNVRSMQAVLLLFEQVSGLKVNFNKSLITRVNVSDSWLYEAAMVLNCRVGTLPFVYLGLPIGGDSRKRDFWRLVLNSITSRLSNWKRKILLFGARLILLKSVLSSLLVYFLSFFTAPTGIISSIESLFKFFFWGVVRMLEKLLGLTGTLYVYRRRREG